MKRLRAANAFHLDQQKTLLYLVQCLKAGNANALNIPFNLAQDKQTPIFAI